LHIVSLFIFLLLLLFAIAVLIWRRGRKAWFGAIVLVLALNGVSVVFFQFHCPAAKKRGQLQWTMTREDIVALLGPPSVTKTYPDGYTLMGYGSPFLYCTLDIYFDPTGKISRMFHDH
jgi:hypothetical protein